jgi:GAF domain-containing protein
MDSARSDDVVTPEQLDGVTVALEALASALDDAGELDTTLELVCRQVVDVLPDADLASVTLIRASRPVTAAATDSIVDEIDAAQYRAGSGPCLEAATTGKLVRADVASAHRRWPEFASSAIEAGVASYLSAPLTVDTRHAGALNIYGKQPHGFLEVDGALLEVYLAAVETALRATARYLVARNEADQLRTALLSRAVIDQAKGLLMGVHGIDANQAFAMLVRQSQLENVKVHAIAAKLLATLTEGRTLGA